MADCGGGVSAISHLPHPHGGTDSDDDDEAPNFSILPAAQGSGSCESPGASTNPSTASGGGAVVPASTESTAVVLRKPRGRPPGSKNKPKPPVVITRDGEAAVRPVVLELSPGSDVLDCISGFARQRCVGVSVLSASGAVSNVALRHPALHASTLTLHGRFDMLSLSGTYLPITTPGPGPSAAAAAPVPAPFSPSSLPIVASAVKSAFTVSLTGSQGQVIGGIVAGPLLAAGPVVLVVASFASPEFHKLPRTPGEKEEAKSAIAIDRQQPSPPILAAHTGGGAGGGSDAVGWRLPQDAINWSSHVDRAPATHLHHSHNSPRHYFTPPSLLIVDPRFDPEERSSHRTT